MTSNTINSNIGHSDNEIDMTGMKNPSDKQADDTRKVGRFVSPDNADVKVLSSSFLNVSLSTDFMDLFQIFPLFNVQLLPAWMTDWAVRGRLGKAHQSKKKWYELLDYIIKLVTEENSKIFNGGMTEFQEYLDVDEKCQEYAYVRPAEILERSHFRQERRNGEYTAERSDCSIGCFLFSDDIDGESGRMD